MYTRSARINYDGAKQDIPVETFGDSFSADAFIKNEAMYSEQINKENPETHKEILEKTSAADIEEKSIEKPRRTININTDDLLLIGLLLLFITDNDSNTDLMLPLLLAVILIFN